MANNGQIHVTHDRTSGHSHHICYKRGCSVTEKVGCSCACDCSDDGVDFYGEAYGMKAGGTIGTAVHVAHHKKLSKLGHGSFKTSPHFGQDTYRKVLGDTPLTAGRESSIHN
jgi:hypothetical protein